MIENEIQMLTDKEHCLRRPGMYIGSVAFEPHERFLFGKFQKLSYVPGLLKLIDEILDNSTDEAIRTNFKFANKIDVRMDAHSVKIFDNGRGIPQNDIVTPEGETLPAPVAAWTRTRAGGNFGEDKDRMTGGQNGVGSSLTNIFSTRFIGITQDGKSCLKVNCTNGASDISWTKSKTAINGTSVEFWPDFEHFEVNAYSETDMKIIEYRLQELSVVYPDIEFTFNNKKINGSFKKFCKEFDDEAIIIESDTCVIGFARSDDGFRQLSYVNNINTKNGGTHLDYVIDEISNNLIPSIKRKYNVDITKARIKECLTVIMMIRNMSNLRFDSQTKERFSSPYGEVKTHINLDCKKISKAILAAEPIITPIIESALARKMAAEKAAETKATKAAAKAKVAKHTKANLYGKPGKGTQLFIAEGLSAIGELLNTRDRDLHGGYPLRGKVLNTWGMSPGDQIKNSEIFDLVAILGLKFGEKVVDMPYDYINIFTDSDHDGLGSIYPSLLAFFSQWPELFKEQRIRFVKTPIVIASKNEDDYKNPKWYYSLEEYEKDKPNLEKLKYKNIRYIKGLGSLRKEEYKKSINEPVLDIIQLGDNYKELFEMLFGDDAQLRKEWMSK